MIPGYVKFRAYLSADQDDIAGAGAGHYKIALNAETYDIGSDFDTTNNCFVVPITGYYQINAALKFEGGADFSGGNYAIEVYVDPLGAGSPALKAIGQQIYHTAAGGVLGLCLSDTIKLTKTDKVYLYCYTDDTNVDIDGGETLTYMSITLISQWY
jgi:hypothetical protein